MKLALPLKQHILPNFPTVLRGGDVCKSWKRSREVKLIPSQLHYVALRLWLCPSSPSLHPSKCADNATIFPVLLLLAATSAPSRPLLPMNPQRHTRSGRDTAAQPVISSTVANVAKDTFVQTHLFPQKYFSENMFSSNTDFV